jgi:hypothetical protein
VVTNCGDVELNATAVQVQRFAPADHYLYAFTCPGCSLLVTKPATPRVVELLVRAGVEAFTFFRPAELDEVHAGPAITYDDLLSFHYEVSDTGWLDSLIGAR